MNWNRLIPGRKLSERRTRYVCRRSALCPGYNSLMEFCGYEHETAGFQQEKSTKKEAGRTKSRVSRLGLGCAKVNSFYVNIAKISLGKCLFRSFAASDGRISSPDRAQIALQGTCSRKRPNVCA